MKKKFSMLPTVACIPTIHPNTGQFHQLLKKIVKIGTYTIKNVLVTAMTMEFSGY